jgi:hypothetical protein
MHSLTTNHLRSGLRALPLMLLLSCGAAAASAQESEKPASTTAQPEGRPARGERPGPGGVGDGRMLKERLQSRIDEMDRVRERVREAIERLDQGAAPGEVMRDLAPLFRSLGRGEGQGRGEDDELTNMPYPPRRGEGPPGDMHDRPGPENGNGVRGEGRGDREPGDMMGDRPGRGGGPGNRQGNFGPEDREKMLEQLRQNAPELAARLEAMNRAEPAMAQRFGGKLFPRVREALAIREERPELFKLKIREITNAAVVFDSVRQFRDASRGKGGTPDAAKVEECETALRTALAEQYDIRREILTIEVNDLSRHLEKMRADLERHQGDKDKNVQELLQKVKEGKDLRELSAPQGGGPRPPRP